MDKIIHGSSESGFINSNLFDRWVENALIPYIKQKREEHKYEGPALLLLVGASSHFTKFFFDQCNANKIKLFFLPPHSSNQTQPLDLGIFHLHMDKIRQYSFDDDDKIKSLLDSFHSVASLGHIQGAFEASGAVYELGDRSQCPIVHWSKKFATKLIENPLSKAQKKELRKERNGWSAEVIHEIRMNVSDLYDKNPQSQEKIYKSFKKVPQIIVPDKKEVNRLINRLLSAFVSDDEIYNEPIEENWLLLMRIGCC